MTHPLVPQITDLAAPIARELNLELVEIVFQTNKNPPVLRLCVSHSQDDVSLEDCERMSRALEAELDASSIIPGSYVLEVSSPGISSTLKTERDFISFKGFPVLIKTSAPYKNKQEWHGKLRGRDEEAIYINQKGKAIAIPRDLVAEVKLTDYE